MRLSILCVTTMAPHAALFLAQFFTLGEELGAETVFVADGEAAFKRLRDARGDGGPAKTAMVRSTGFIESVLDEALALTSGDMILRLDDDELPTPAMREWLLAGKWLDADHWHFPRLHLWPDRRSVLMTPQLFPDAQTRLSSREKSGGRPHLHAMSPWGMGKDAGVAIEHHKFLSRTRAEREDTSRRWHSGGMKPFSLPEDVYGEVEIVDRGWGKVPWTPAWRETRQMGAAR